MIDRDRQRVQLHALLREQLRLAALKERLAGIRANEPVSDEDVREFYDQNIHRFNIPAHLTVQDIVFFVPASSAPDLDRAKKAKADAAAEQAKKPSVSFPSLARQQSEGPRAKAGGDLGQVTEGSIDPLLWSQLARMQPSEISEVIRTSDGYHVLKLLRRNPEVRQSLEQAQEHIKATIRARRHSAKLTELITGLRAQARIENHLFKRYPQIAHPSSRSKKTGALEGGVVSPALLSPLLPPGPEPKSSRPGQFPD
jgi:parvulin-like peptidyl-prolyl isomerase